VPGDFGVDLHCLLRRLVPVKQLLLDRPEKEKHCQDEEGGEYRRNVKAKPDSHADRRHHPDRGSGRQAVDLVALAQDGARAEESNACHDLGGDTGRIGRRAEGLKPEP
jgi:hypothetical protein